MKRMLFSTAFAKLAVVCVPALLVCVAPVPTHVPRLVGQTNSSKSLALFTFCRSGFIAWGSTKLGAICCVVPGRREMRSAGLLR